MSNFDRDPSLDTLLNLNGVTFAVNDSVSPHWVKFIVNRVPVSKNKPHGLDYSLTLHSPTGERLIGFDNAHPVKEGSGPGCRTRILYDHQHEQETVRFYNYADAGQLLEDFWKAVDTYLKEYKP